MWACGVLLISIVTAVSDPHVLLYDPLDGAETIAANGGSATGVTFVEGKAGNAALIDGAIAYPYGGHFNRDAGTIQFLLRPDDAGSMGLLEAGKLGYANSIGIFRTVQWTRQIAAMEVRKNDSSYLQAWHDTEEVRLENGQWYLVTAVWAANQAPNDFFQLYLNDVPGYRHSGSVCTPLLDPTTQQIRLGETYWYGGGRGTYDELRIYDYAKSAAEIAADYRAYFGMPAPELAAITWLSDRQSLVTGLLPSQVGFADQRAFTYDQALAAVAFTHAGQLAKAQRILDRMAALQNLQGYWTSAYYAAGDGVFEWNVDTGPIAWMVIAANYYAAKAGDDRYRDMANRAITWLETRIDRNPASGSRGALNLGVNFWNVPNSEQVYGTEHQLDAYAALRGRALFAADEATRGRLRTEADAVLAYLLREVWKGDHFQRGFNDPETWLDCQTWGLLALGVQGPGGEPFATALAYAGQTMQRTLNYNSSILAVNGFSYNNYQDTVWIEGTLQAALAYVLFGSVASGDHYAGEMARTVRSDGGLSYSFDQSGSAEDNWPLNLRYSAVSSMVWYYFYDTAFNPFAVKGDGLPLGAIYRFWSPAYSHHFFTVSGAERDKLVTEQSGVWTYETVAYYALPEAGVPNSLPVYRFWSDTFKGHFYTIDEAEKDKLRDYPAAWFWTYEGPAWQAYPPTIQPEDTLPVYRFWSNTLGSHFYTMDEAEKNKLLAYPAAWFWTYEGIAWYAYP
jgi:hypothetical protein